MSSRRSLVAPWLHAQRGSGGSWQRRECQRTSQTRQLRENDSRGTVRSVDSERIDGGHHDGERRRGEIRRGYIQHRVQDCANRAAGRTRAALLLVAVDALYGRGRPARVNAVFMRRCSVVAPANALRGELRMRVPGRRHLLAMGACRATVVRTAKRHGRGSSALSGNRQNQQPDQKRSNQQTHPSTLQQAVAGVRTKAFPPAQAPTLRY